MGCIYFETPCFWVQIICIKNSYLNYIVGWFIGFYGISPFVGYLTPNPFLCK